MQPYYERNGITIYCGDCLEVMPGLGKNTANLIFVDWPYFKVKNETWDKQWDDPKKFLGWIEETLVVSKKVLKPNGSFYGCASPNMSRRVETEITKHFNVLTTIRWYKEDGWHKKTEKEMLRQYLQPWEAIIFAEQKNYARSEQNGLDDIKGFVFEPIRQYLDGERQRAGLTQNQVNEICKTASMAGRHYFSRSQWCMPIREHYELMQVGFNQLGKAPNGSGEYLRRDYEYLRRDYEDLRRDYEDLRRPFNANPKTPHTDLWNFAPVKDHPRKHPTEKPMSLLLHVIKMSTRKNDTVLDFCMGAGVTLLAARDTGRRAVGIELSEGYCKIAVERLRQPSFFSIAEDVKPVQPKQLDFTQRT